LEEDALDSLGLSRAQDVCATRRMEDYRKEIPREHGLSQVTHYFFEGCKYFSLRQSFGRNIYC